VEAYLTRGEANLAEFNFLDAIHDFQKALDLQPSAVRALKGRCAAVPHPIRDFTRVSIGLS
jgi:hypothetical protein